MFSLRSLHGVRRLLVAVVGATVVLIGVALLVLPGPAVLVIPAGLAILATEFAWARRLLRRVRERAGLNRPASSGDRERGAAGRSEP
ncbi:MAG: PGPGW domain-containing protein [Proteobacteria bacterium]|nr:PGPGW domain-containing protein [Pseudomonadota bacterium]